MHKLIGSQLKNLPLGNLTWKRDLLYFEGPLLSEYYTEKGETFLKYWCDCNEDYHRWMLFKIKEQDRLRLVLGEKSIHAVIQEQPDFFVFFSDENKKNKKFTLVELTNIPN
ncbi:hypothetical protein CAG70_13015, partial [Photobacterium halotolerans]|uniref:hypothetical protein n=1 Tax=Photobacterium halotolerans TaxID=265726 RepID=UPI00142B4892